MNLYQIYVMADKLASGKKPITESTPKLLAGLQELLNENAETEARQMVQDRIDRARRRYVSSTRG